MSLPVYRRKFHSFISSVNVNRDVVEQIEHWLTDKAGISVLHDTHSFHSGDSFEGGLESSLELCQSMIILLTKQGIESGQVGREFELGLKQQSLNGNMFRLIPIRIDECMVPNFLHSPTYIDMTEDGFNLAAAAKLLLGFYSIGLDSEEGKNHDVFISRPWTRGENGLTNLVCKVTKRIGFRLIGDPTEQQKNNEPLMRLIAGCGGGIAVIPNEMGDRTTKKIFNELEIMCNLELPFLVVVESAVKLPDFVVKNALGVLRFDERPSYLSVDSEKQIQSIVLRLQEEWMDQPKHQYIFYGTDLKDEHKVRNRLLRRVVQQISAAPCLMGEDIQHGHIQGEIVNMIVNAQMMIADISRENLNTCIEAGIGIGANVPLNLLSGDERHKPPFMFRDRQIWHYQNDLDLLGVIHKLILPYRRYVI